MESKLTFLEMKMEFEFIQVDSDGIFGIVNHFLSLRILLKLKEILSGPEEVKKSDGLNRQVSRRMLPIMVRFNCARENHHRQMNF
jgi:hypothetical protein